MLAVLKKLSIIFTLILSGIVSGSSNVCVLLCDDLNDIITQKHHHLPYLYEDFIKQSIPDATVIFFPAYQSVFPKKEDGCDAVIISGGRPSANDEDPWVNELLREIKQYHNEKMPLVGICLGHQMIAKALGGKVERSEEWGVGIKENNLLVIKDWMTPKPTNTNDAVSLIFSHRDQVTELPQGAQLLASAKHCPNAIYQIDDHVLSIQAHPEFTKGIVEELWGGRYHSGIIPTDIYEEALKSLTIAPDSLLVSQWIANFLQVK